MQASLTHIYGMLEKVPPADRPEGKNLVRFWEYVAWELHQLITYAQCAKKPEIVLSDMRQAGTQYIWEFWVNDLELPLTNAMNWHGQFTSQWVYAGAIVLQHGEVSTHH